MSTINTNNQALTAAMNLDRNQGLLGNAIESLSSGSKINSPADDPAGVAVADTLGADNDRLTAAGTNVQNALSYTQTSDSFLSSMGQILERMDELAADAQDPTKNASDVSDYQQEFKALQDQLRSMIGGTASQIGGSGVSSPSGEFNGTQLFGSTAAGGTTLDIGAQAGQQLTIPDINLQTGAMQALIQQDGSGNYLETLGSGGISASISSVIGQVASSRSTLGAVESRLGLASSSIQVEQQNISSAISNVSDVDVAQESTLLAQYNILVQAGASMLAQANLVPQSMLKLLQGGG